MKHINEKTIQQQKIRAFCRPETTAFPQYAE